MSKSLLTHLGEALDAYRTERRQETGRQADHASKRWLRFLPSPGNILFTLLLVLALFWAQTAGALPGFARAANTRSAPSTIAYQGRLADADGNPLTDTVNMIFRLYGQAGGGAPLWEEQWTGSNGVQVSDGLFNVMLGSLTPIPQDVITGNDQLFLGITVGADDEMAPRVQLGSVPFAVQALTVPDGSVTTEKIADGAVTSVKLQLEQLGIGTFQPNSKLELEDLDSAHLALTLENADTRAGIELESQGATAPGEGIFNFGIGTNRGILPKGDQDRAWFRIDTRAAWKGFAWLWAKPNGGGEPTIMSLSRNGDLWVSGTKSSVVQTDEFGQRKLYAVEAPDVRFSDEGMAQLRAGSARVELDPIFLETIEGEYLVHVTPYGAASIYVAEIGRDYFVVKSLDGHSDVPFAWRLSAPRKGYANVRLEKMNN